MEIKASDLRIGNYLDRNGLMEVRGINFTKIALYDHVNKCAYKTWWKLDKWIKPIQLTEQWLIDFGFFKVKGDIFLIGEFEIDKTDNEFRYYPINRKKIIIKSIHQLQNLFWCLTGKELTK